MRFKNTWILLIVAVTALAYFFLIEQPRHEREQLDEAADLMLTDISRDAITGIIIESAGKRVIELDKRNGTWKLVAPITDIADETTINTLIMSIAEAEIERRLDPTPELLSEFGLDETATRLTFLTAGSDTVFTLTVGRHTLTKSHFYARKDAHSDVLFLPATIRRYAVKEIPDFRDKRIVDFRLEDVMKYRVASDSATISWELRPDRGWITVQDGDTIPGDRQEVEAPLRQLRALRVRSFVSDNPLDFDQYWTSPHHTLSVWIAGAAEPLTIRCGRAEEGEFYAKRDDADRIVKLDGIFLTLFDKTVDDLRDKRLLSFTREEISTITCHSPDTSATLVKSGASWSSPNPTLGAVDESAVNSLLTQLELLKFDATVQNESRRLVGHGFDTPSYSIELFDAGGKRVDQVLAGVRDPESGALYITSDSSGLLALIDEQKLGDILTSFRRMLVR